MIRRPMRRLGVGWWLRCIKSKRAWARIKGRVLMTISSTDFECMMAEKTKYASCITSYVRIDRCMPCASINQEKFALFPLLSSTPFPRLSINQTHPLKDSPLCFPPVFTPSLLISPSLQVYPSPRTSFAYSTTIELPALHMLRVPSQIPLERCARPAHLVISMASLRRKKRDVRQVLGVKQVPCL